LRFLSNSKKYFQSPHRSMDIRMERADNIAELNIPVRTGNAIEPTSITNDGCKLMATSQGNFGSAWHGVSWIAVGEI